jgi:prepilin-type N-terminal cleavage/methylation domain-containing protein
MKANLKTSFQKRGQEGFTLVELLCSIIIFTIVIGSIYALMAVARTDRNMSSERSDLMKQLRYTMNLMGRDALNAGYSYQKNGAVVPDNFLATRLGVNTDIDTNRDLLVGVVSGNNIFTNSLQDPANLQRTDVISFVYRDISFNPDTLTNTSRTLSVSSTVADTGDIARIILSAGNTTSVCNVNDLFLLESQNSALLLMATAIPSSTSIQFANGDPLGVNQTYTQSILRPCANPDDQNCMDYPASIKRVYWVSFKVKDDGTLLRIIYGNNGNSTTQIQEQPLAYGIENLQIKYLMEDGTVTDDPAAGADGILGTTDDTPVNLNLVRQVQFTATAKGNDIDPRTGKVNRITMSATFSTRNMGYDVG